LSNIRLGIEPRSDFFVRITFNLPKSDLPKIGFIEQIEKSPALVGHLGRFLARWRAG